MQNALAELSLVKLNGFVMERLAKKFVFAAIIICNT